MGTENILAKRISVAGDRTAYDEACKQLLANKQILAWIIKTCVEEFRECSIKDIAEKHIEGIPEIGEAAVHRDEAAEFIGASGTEDVTITEGTVTFDIRFRATVPVSDELMELIINVEAQNDFYPGYPLVKRGIYYGSRMISGQYGTVFEKSHYELLKKVYSIWICMNPPKYRRNTIGSYSFAEKNLVGKLDEEKRNFDLITVVMVCLGDSSDQRYEGLLKMLDVLLQNEHEPKEKKKILQNEFDITMTSEMESEVDEMCNLSKGVLERGYKKGYDAAVLNIIRQMMQTKGWTADQCMEAMGISPDQYDNYNAMLKKEPLAV